MNAGQERFVGTSGFAYPDWRPRFYPDGLAQAKLLAHYATRLNSVEINYTFNRFPTEKLLAGWAEKTPESFVFSLKLPKAITHIRKLRDCAEDLSRFVAPVRSLGRRLGAVLVQTAPTFQADHATLKSFLAPLPPDIRFGFEFRHPSWNTDDTLRLLGEHGCAWVWAEDDDADATMHDTAAGFAYLRLRKSAYPDVADWARRIAAIDADVYAYLRHDEDGANALAAENLSERHERMLPS